MTVNSWANQYFKALEQPGFDIGAYSRLKHGSDLAARLLGHEMADGFLFDNKNFFEKEGDNYINGGASVVVIPAPGTNVPVAATLLAKHFTEYLNFRLVQKDLKPVEMAHVHRYMSYTMNTYAEISAEERLKLLSGDSLFFPESFVAGKRIIFIDDVCITGTHENKLEKELTNRGIDNQRIYACFAKYTGDDPSVEARLNKTAIKGPLDIVWLAQEAGFTVTVRCLRLLLEAREDDLQQVLRGLPRRLREEFCAAAIEKGYYKYPEYKDSYFLLRESIR